MKFFRNHLKAIFRRDLDIPPLGEYHDSPEVTKAREEAVAKQEEYYNTSETYRKQVKDHECTIRQLQEQIEFLNANANKLEQMAENISSVFNVEKYQGPLDPVEGAGNAAH